MVRVVIKLVGGSEADSGDASDGDGGGKVGGGGEAGGGASDGVCGGRQSNPQWWF